MASEIDNFLAWLKYALANRKEQHPAQSAERACLNIAQDASKAGAWGKFKREKPTAFRPKANPYLADDRNEAWRGYLFLGAS